MCALCNIIYYLEPKEASKSISQCSKPTCAKYRTHGLYVAPPPSLAARGRAISCALPRSRFLPQGRQPNPTQVLPGVHCPAHSLLLYIRLYRAFPWWIKISMYPWFFSTWGGQPSLSRSHKSSSSTCTNFPQCPTHFFGSHFILSIRIISIDFALKGEPVPGTVYQYLYLENKYRI